MTFCFKNIQKNWVTNSDFLIPISLQPNVVDMNCIRSNNLDLKYYMLKLSGCKNIGIRKSEFAIQFNVFFGPLKKGSYWSYTRTFTLLNEKIYIVRLWNTLEFWNKCRLSFLNLSKSQNYSFIVFATNIFLKKVQSTFFRHINK